MLASINRAEPNATLMAGLAVLVIAIYVGCASRSVYLERLESAAADFLAFPDAIPRPSMRVWFRWLSYAQPVSFGFEVLLTNEFRKLNVPCATLVPAGPSYPAIAVANQACAGTQGSTPGSAIVIGSQYMEQNFGYKWSHTWRNFGFVSLSSPSDLPFSPVLSFLVSLADLPHWADLGLPALLPRRQPDLVRVPT